MKGVWLLLYVTAFSFYICTVHKATRVIDLCLASCLLGDGFNVLSVYGLITIEISYLGHEMQFLLKYIHVLCYLHFIYYFAFYKKILKRGAIDLIIWCMLSYMMLEERERVQICRFIFLVCLNSWNQGLYDYIVSIFLGLRRMFISIWLNLVIHRGPNIVL